MKVRLEGLIKCVGVASRFDHVPLYHLKSVNVAPDPSFEEFDKSSFEHSRFLK